MTQIKNLKGKTQDEILDFLENEFKKKNPTELVRKMKSEKESDTIKINLPHEAKSKGYYVLGTEIITVHYVDDNPELLIVNFRDLLISDTKVFVGDVEPPKLPFVPLDERD